jgi:hypothetical protein
MESWELTALAQVGRVIVAALPITVLTDKPRVEAAEALGRLVQLAILVLVVLVALGCIRLSQAPR